MKTSAGTVAGLAVWLVGFCLPGLATTSMALQYGGFTYEVNPDGSSVTITDYYGTGGAVAIPDSIESKVVSAIGDSAFYGANTMTGITIPDSVQSIGNSAFFLCYGLSSITVPNSVTNIGQQAFYSCNKVTNIVIGSEVSSIGQYAFVCANLKTITVDAGNSIYSSNDGVLFNKDQTILITCPRAKPGSYTMPISTRSIDRLAFYSCRDLTHVEIGHTVTNIGDNAFTHCSELAIITIPDSVTSIGESAFSACYALADVILGRGISQIRASTFNSCESLASIIIPDNVLSIGDTSFKWCYALVNMTIGSNVTNIGAYAFQSCTNLVSIVIPDSVTSVGNYAFVGCSAVTNFVIGSGITSVAFGIPSAKLTEITVVENNTAFSSSDGVLFDKDLATLIRCPGAKTGRYAIPFSTTNINAGAFGGSSLSNISIPDSITLLEPNTFSRCYNLAHITIPNSITDIGVWVFYNSSNLTSVTIGHSVTNIGYNAFSGCTHLEGAYFKGNAPSLDSAVFYLADNATVYYLPNTSGWGTTFGERPTQLWTPLIQTDDGSFGVQGGKFGFNISGHDSELVKIETCTNLVAGSWEPMTTTQLSGGSVYFSDPDWINHPSRCYRLHMP